ncbi:MAG: PAS domain S-box protein [Candidatus Latescibacteria bacterium]|nr:PAS domain S-box protein [Candidatus Latescibacterota bacterium]
MCPRKQKEPSPEVASLQLTDENEVREMLSLLLENTRDAIYLPVGKRFPLINRGFEEMFGVTLEEVNSPCFHFMDLVAPESRPIVIERAEMYARGERVTPEYEFKAITGDGRELIVRTNTTRIKYHGEDATLGIVRDITVRKQVEEALQESEEKYRTLVERANDGIAILQDGKLVFVNKRLADSLGYTVEEMLDTPMTGYMHPEYEEDLVDRYRRRMAGEEFPSIYEAMVRHRDGSDRHAEINAGTITFMDRPADLIFARDITDRKKAEKELRESEDRYSSLFQHSHDAIFLHDTDANILDVNDRALELFGYEKPEMLALKIYELHPPEALDVSREAFKEISREGFTEFEIDFKKKDGEIFPAQVSSSMFDLGGKRLVQGAVRDVTERKRTEEALRISESNLRTLFETMVEGVVWVAADGGFIRANRAAEQILRLKRADTEEIRYLSPDWEMLNEEGMSIQFEESAWIRAIREKAPVRDAVTGIRFPDGTMTWINLTVIPLLDEQERPTGGVGTFSDITERRQLERQLLQAQKMEAIGRLAGGIAHDFNNILTVISGNVQLGMMSLKEGDPLRERLETIQKASGHAEELTRRLLAFGRKQITSPQVLNINEILYDLKSMVYRIIGEDIELVIQPGGKVGPIMFDPTQMEQILVNLVVNARDAMPEGGILKVETTEVVLGEDYLRVHPYVETGRYVRVTVSDSGKGMSEETRLHLFEPFFTTKESGSGLGLATVYGIVKQSGGSIEVSSREGVGTTFRIYLPVVDAPAVPLIRKEREPELQHGIETILLVEDEEGVRNFAAEVLSELGYTVQDFANPEEALAFYEDEDRTLDLILTDVVMPGASGAELAERLQPRYPSVPVLFMSGYTDDFIVHHGVLDEGVAFLPKPFSPNELAGKVREILDAT